MSLKHCNDLKDLINYSNYIDDIYENIDNLSKKCKKLFAFDDMIADMLNTKTSANSYRAAYQKHENKYFSFVNYLILLCRTISD